MKNIRIVIAGGSGFIGQAMAARWSPDNDVTVLTRGGKAANNNYGNANIAGVKFVSWDGKTLGDWQASIDGCDLLINLAGKSVNCRYNAANKQEIMESRINSTTILGAPVQKAKVPPKLWINGGSATIYPFATDAPRDESFTQFEDDFSVQVCKNWEGAFNGIDLSSTRKAILRMAIVLGEGGVMVPYKRLVKFGLGGRQGNGRQMFSWIHIEDLCRVVEWLWMNDAQSGVFNASAPNPLNNAAFMKSLRTAYGILVGVPAPEFLLKLGAAIIGTETELLLKSRWVLPTRLQRAGFVFKYATLPEALKHL